MRISTFIFLIITLMLYIATIILSILILHKDLLPQELLIIYIVLDSISVIYIIYRFFYIKTINGLTLVLKYIFVLFNLANIIVVICYIAKKKEILSKKYIQVYVIYEIIFFLKFYFHILSVYRNKTKEGKGCSYNIIGEDEEYDIEMNEMIKENSELKRERERLNKSLKTNKVSYKNKNNNNKNHNIDIFAYKKIEIICSYIKINHGKKISKDSLNKKFLTDIKYKYGLIVDKNKYDEIAINFAKERISECLKCPLTKKIFSNPVITPNGQTFDKIAILKKIEENGKNPVNNNKLESKDLVQNTLVLDICEILNQNNDCFTKNNFDDIRNLLISKVTNKLYENPVVIYDLYGYDIGKTKEGNITDLKAKYKNLVIKDLIEQNKAIFDDNFFKYNFDINKGEDDDINNISNIILDDNIISTTRNKLKIIDELPDFEDIKKADETHKTDNTETISVLRRIPSQK